MDKSIYTARQEAVRKWLVGLRTRKKLNQRQLAERLERERNLVGRLEVGERRLDWPEFYEICLVCDADPMEEAAIIIEAFRALPKRKK